MYKLMFPLLAILVIFSLGFFTLDFGSDVVGSAHGGVDGYADAGEFFYGYHTLTADYSDGELSAIVNGNVGDVFVYKNAYYDLDGEWTAIELESTSVDESQEGAWNDSWIRGSAEGSVEVDFDEYYVAAYVCRLYNQSEVLDLQNWPLDQRLLINHTFDDELDYLCGVGGFHGGELVINLWHHDRIECEDCDPEPANSDVFVTVWDTRLEGESAENEILLPLEESGEYDFVVSTNGTLESSETVTSHSENNLVFEEPGVYEVNLTGVIEGWRFNDQGDKLKLLEIKNWGDIKLSDNGAYFFGAQNLDISATDVLNTSGMTNFNSFFRSSENDYSEAGYGISSVPNIQEWDVSAVSDMSYMFYAVPYFSEDLSSWDVGNVEDMSYMFWNALFYNEPLDWDVSSVKNMSHMFSSTHFNQQLDWDVSSVVDMGGMFRGADSFNQPLGDWDVSSVENMEEMFLGTSSFNQDLSSWDVALINSEPFRFSYNSALAPENHPCWGSAGCDAVPVNALCGSNAKVHSLEESDWPSENTFCDRGTLDGDEPNFPQPSQQVSWMCLGENGGEPRLCMASRASEIVDSSCGANNQTFAHDIDDWPSNDFCDPGTVSPTNPEFPAQGETMAWSCLATDGGTPVECTAQREAPQPDGSETNPYLITTCQELQDIDDDLTSHYALVNDIDCSGVNFDPIGDESAQFIGSLNGNENTITLFIDRPSEDYVGLFANLEGDVSDLIVDADIVGAGSVGSLAGRSSSSDITSVSVIGSISSHASFLGGVVGLAGSGTVIDRSSSYATITGLSDWNSGQAGGLVGRLHAGTIVESYSYGTIQTNSRAGGLVGQGQAGAIIENSYSRSSVSAQGTAGGLAGFLGGHTGGVEEVYTSFSTGQVTSPDLVGGFVASADSGTTFEQAYWDTQTSGQSSSAGGTGKTTSEMRTQSTFEGAGWDFTNVWAIDSNKNDGYPYLRNNPLE